MEVVDDDHFLQLVGLEALQQTRANVSQCPGDDEFHLFASSCRGSFHVAVAGDDSAAGRPFAALLYTSLVR